MEQAWELWLFFVVVLGVIALPGMDMAFVLASALAGGRPAGAAAVGGIVAGGICHVAMGALGVATVLAVWPGLFNAVLVAGALYFAWIGVSLIRSNSGFVVPAYRTGRRGPVFMQGMLTCLLNPKAYMFMLAIFPQFLRAEGGPLWMQAGTLGMITAATQVFVYGSVAMLALRAREWLTTGARSGLLVARSVGVLLLCVALLTVTQGWRFY